MKGLTSTRLKKNIAFLREQLAPSQPSYRATFPKSHFRRMSVYTSGLGRGLLQLWSLVPSLCSMNPLLARSLREFKLRDVGNWSTDYMEHNGSCLARQFCKTVGAWR